jgi:hypothetical protein
MAYFALTSKLKLYMINWFGTMYYGNNKEFKRTFKVSLSCFMDKIKWRITGSGYYLYNDRWYHFYWWNKKKITKEYLKNFEDKNIKFTKRGGKLWIS